MAGRILVVDDLEPNRRLLQARLEAEYYDVLMAEDGLDAVAVARAKRPDLILLDVMMPRMDGFEACRILKEDPDTAHIPVVMVTALDQREDRLAGLEAGADDFLTKPLDDIALFARVRSLLRLKVVLDELREREAAARAKGAIAESARDSSFWTGARVLIVHDEGRSAERMSQRLSEIHEPTIIADPKAAVQTAVGGRWDLILVDLNAETFDGMRVAARLRSDEATRHVPVLAIVEPGERDRTVRALDLGVNDVLASPVDAQELAARVKTQVRHKRYADFLRAALDQSAELAVVDQLTGLHNRRFMTGQLQELLEASARDGLDLAVAITDLDHFKTINDQYGHDAGDAVLRQFGERLAAASRAMDYACRYGGEEFVVMMPGASLDQARGAGERIRKRVEDEPFALPSGQSIDVTVSVGVARREARDTPDKVLKRADQALYAAKQRGRNRVVVATLKSRANGDAKSAQKDSPMRRAI